MTKMCGRRPLWRESRSVARHQENGRRRWRNNFDINEREQQYVGPTHEESTKKNANCSVGARLRLMIREDCLPVRGSK